MIKNISKYFIFKSLHCVSMQTDLFEDFSKIPDRKIHQNVISIPKSESDGQQKVENIEKVDKAEKLEMDLKSTSPPREVKVD